MRIKKVPLIIGAALILTGVIIVTIWAVTRDHATQPLSINEPSLVNERLLAEYPIKQASTAHLERLDATITPPTNSWISGLALQADPKAVFPMPYSFKALDTEFQIGLPKVTATATEITGGHKPDATVRVQSADTFKLSRFDKTSAHLTYYQGDTDLGVVTITQGSPYVFYRAAQETKLLMPLGEDVKQNETTLRYTAAGSTVTLKGFDGSLIKSDGSDATIVVPRGGLISWYILTVGQRDALAEYAGNEVTSVELNYEITNDAALTKFTYTTKNNLPTVLVSLPYQSVRSGNAISATYQSIYGDMKLHKGNEFTLVSPRIKPLGELDLSKLRDDEKQKLIVDLRRDSETLTIDEQDTYFAGKKLARLATLLSLSKQLQVEDISEKVQSALKAELTKRLSKDYLYYDSELKGMAGQTSGFGSEDFNDHHFHYGYFIQSAAILARYDPAFLTEHEDAVNLLVADIASYKSTQQFPLLRHYDPYSGHSWAAGLAPFDDGNNQESSSEAINAWNATALWADITKNQPLKQASEWMLANEMQTAEKAWRSVDTSAPYLRAYTAPVASLNFGGKRTYATFFSDESNAKLGIQLIPFSPVMKDFARDGQRISQKIAKQDTPEKNNVALGDYLLMYTALENKNQALVALESQQDAFIDNGNSRAYIRAWIYVNGS